MRRLFLTKSMAIPFGPVKGDFVARRLISAAKPLLRRLKLQNSFNFAYLQHIDVG